MKIKELYIQQYHQFNAFHLDLTYPTGHPKAGQALDKVCFIGQSGTGKTSLLEVLFNVISILIKESEVLPKEGAIRLPLDKKLQELEKFDELYGVGINLKFDNDVSTFITKNATLVGENFLLDYDSQEENNIHDFLKNSFKLVLYPCDIDIPTIGKQPQEQHKSTLGDNILNFGNYDLQSSWGTINEAIIKDRELEIKKSLDLSKLLQNPIYSQDEVWKAREEFLAWRKASPNPIVDLADNFLNKIIGRFNLKVKTELDFEKTEDIETIKIQTAQGKDIPFEALSTGTKQVILTALPLYGLKPENAIILFDEPERSLYPDIQAEIVDFYTSMAKDSQFFFATHSPLVASSFEPWEVVELKFNPETGNVYQELYYDAQKERHVDSYFINPQYLTWTGILQKVFDLDQEGNDLRDRQLIRIATLESQLKQPHLSLEQKKEKFEEYKKLATLLNWELKKHEKN